MHPNKLLSCVLALVASGAPALPQSNLYVVGDSLSDNGNLYKWTGIPGAPYWKGRHSNGRLWVEQLAQVLGLDPDKIQDFAVGGATTTDVFKLQVQPLIAATKGQLPGDAIYLYWAGAMDLLNLLKNPAANPQLVIMNAMQQTASSLTALALSGAKTIVVVNLPDLSKTPRVIALEDPVATAGALALAQAYNQALAGTIMQLEAGFKMDILELDAFALIQDIVDEPKDYMLKKVDRPAIKKNGKVHEDTGRYLFFDDIHPTTTGHTAIMRVALRVLGRDIPGDVNSDCLVNKKDLEALKKAYGPCGSSCPADMNGDGWVDKQDKKILEKMLGKH